MCSAAAGLAVGFEAERLLEVVDEAVAAVRILQRRDEHEDVVQDAGDHVVIAGGEQVVGGHQGGVGGRDLVAVDAVGQPDDGGEAGDELARLRVRRLPRIGERLHAGADFGEPLDVGFGSDGRVDELAALPGLAVLENLQARRSGCQRFEVLQQLRM